jgi:hypothetical protein
MPLDWKLQGSGHRHRQPPSDHRTGSLCHAELSACAYHRARDQSHVYELWSAGCHDVIRETFDSAIRAGRSVYEALGIPAEQAERLSQNFVAHNRRTLRELADLHNPAITPHQNVAYLKRARELMDEQTEQLRTRGGTLPADEQPSRS